ncbi:hypothetical protein G3M81_11420 [Bacillus paralicheniformis]|nr:hypothetical protein [Bacillus paralicheniformis]QII49312.1 hypothetical protein G3M81_11420 [Bacillus paralicheniformis]
MSTSVVTIIAIFSVVIWIAVSREVVKPTKMINRRKMITLLSAGTLSTLIITISLFQNLSFFH